MKVSKIGLITRKNIELDKLYPIQDMLIKTGQIERKAEQMERLILKQKYIDEYKIKFSFDFLQKLLAFCDKIKNSFNGKSLSINDINISDNDINYLFYDKFSHLDINTRIIYISDYIVNEHFYFVKNQLRIKLLKQQIYKSLYSMFDEKNSVKLYINF